MVCRRTPPAGGVVPRENWGTRGTSIKSIDLVDCCSSTTGRRSSTIGGIPLEPWRGGATMTIVGTETGLRVERLTGRIGAEIGGVNTGEPLDDETIAEIRQALLAHRVVFFRDQSLDYGRQVAFAQATRTAHARPPDPPLPRGATVPRGGRLGQGRARQQLAHRCHVLRPTARLHPPSRRGHARGGRRHHLGQHGLGLRETPQRAPGTGRHATHRAHQHP